MCIAAHFLGVSGQWQGRETTLIPDHRTSAHHQHPTEPNNNTGTRLSRALSATRKVGFPHHFVALPSKGFYDLEGKIMGGAACDMGEDGQQPYRVFPCAIERGSRICMAGSLRQFGIRICITMTSARLDV